jgi:hypothetical protein
VLNPFNPVVIINNTHTIYFSKTSISISICLHYSVILSANNHVHIVAILYATTWDGSPRHAPYLLHIPARGLRVGHYPSQPVSVLTHPYPVTLLPVGSGYF